MLLSMLAVAVLAGNARADEPGWTDVVVVPVECAQFGAIPGNDAESALAWDYVISFASCIQDTTIPTASSPEFMRVFIRFFVGVSSVCIWGFQTS